MDDIFLAILLSYILGSTTVNQNIFLVFKRDHHIAILFGNVMACLSEPTPPSACRFSISNLHFARPQESSGH